MRAALRELAEQINTDLLQRANERAIHMDPGFGISKTSDMHLLLLSISERFAIQQQLIDRLVAHVYKLEEKLDVHYATGGGNPWWEVE